MELQKKESSILSLAKSVMFVAPRNSCRDIDEPFRHALCHNRTERLIEARRLLSKMNIPLRYDESKMDMRMSLTEIPVYRRDFFDYLVLGYKIVRGIYRKITSFFSFLVPEDKDSEDDQSIDGKSEDQCVADDGSGDSTPAVIEVATLESVLVVK